MHNVTAVVDKSVTRERANEPKDFIPVVYVNYYEISPKISKHPQELSVMDNIVHAWGAVLLECDTDF